MTFILVVDDEPRMVRTLTINLRARDYDVESAADGRSALQIIAERAPDVIVLDLGLPDMEGVEVLRRIRETSVVPVVVLSARQDSDDKVEALDAGADDYVTKPYSPREVVARVKTILRRRETGCIFLDGNDCTIYDARPDTCRDFPHLMRGAGSFESRMWQMPDRATYCPIVYNALEAFKTLTTSFPRKRLT